MHTILQKTFQALILYYTLFSAKFLWLKSVKIEPIFCHLSIFTDLQMIYSVIVLQLVGTCSIPRLPKEKL